MTTAAVKEMTSCNKYMFTFPKQVNFERVFGTWMALQAHQKKIVGFVYNTHST